MSRKQMEDRVNRLLNKIGQATRRPTPGMDSREERVAILATLAGVAGAMRRTMSEDECRAAYQFAQAIAEAVQPDEKVSSIVGLNGQPMRLQ